MVKDKAVWYFLALEICATIIILCVGAKPGYSQEETKTQVWLRNLNGAYEDFDIVYMKDGRLIYGKINKQTDSYIILTRKYSTISLPKNDVSKIEMAPTSTPTATPANTPTVALTVKHTNTPTFGGCRKFLNIAEVANMSDEESARQFGSLAAKLRSSDPQLSSAIHKISMGYAIGAEAISTVEVTQLCDGRWDSR
ncbi:MAG: hypothetical protein HYV63_01505 [Candidatus Schekmanbacteria bacterium]|nr:hypothetical protein [Candidatus Schekmanbacteria bacterium]